MGTLKLIELPFETLPESARKVAKDAFDAVSNAIDASISNMRVQVQQDLATSTAALHQEVDSLARDLAQRREELGKILEGVKKLKDDIELGDGQSLIDAVNSTQAHIEGVQKELELYERRWKGLGADVVNKVSMVVGGILK